MAGLEEQLSGLLSDPEGMARLKAMAENLFGGEGKTETPKADAAEGEAFSVDPASLARIASLLKPSRDDESIRLLFALRPHLSPEKQTRLDSAVKMLRLLKMAPKLRELGLFEV